MKQTNISRAQRKARKAATRKRIRGLSMLGRTGNELVTSPKKVAANKAARLDRSIKYQQNLIKKGTDK